jgi:hypothetical protein
MEVIRWSSGLRVLALTRCKEITMTDKEVPLTDSQIEAIAERAAEVALNKVYAEVGKSVLKKLAWLTGAAVIGLALWLAGNQSLPK